VGGTVPAGTHLLRLPLLGRQQVGNAAQAAAAAILAGVPVDDVAAGMARMPSIRRRMEILHPADPLVVDDTSGNARSIHMVRETIATIPHRALRVAYVVRGTRGPTVNEHNAEALAELVAQGDAQLVVSASEDAADARNRVTPEERDAVLGVLRARGIAHVYEPRLADAVHRVLADAGPGDLVLLLGAQGMDGGAELARELLARR
jgi:UDP-N-acetylmuramoyl-L-alanyl-D-glutamate--2,6-diaminopimelate ligase